MKKVGIVSCYFKDNYGSMLQAYATKKFLDQNGIPNETIRIDNNVDFRNGKRKYYLLQLFNFNFIKSKFGMIRLKFDKFFNKELSANINIRAKKFQEFRQEINLSRNCTDYNGLTQLADEKYSDIIVGSDQLWLPVNVIADYYTLNWAPQDINKISYATSFGVSSIQKKYYSQYEYFLKRINHLSVREDNGVKLIKEIANIDATLVCDPTILLTQEEWEEISIKNRIVKEKYILCYFLGNNIEHRKFAEKLKAKTGYKIVSLNHADEYVKYSDVFADIIPYNIGPKEWINLVKYAEYICTDSFHGTVFSLLFNKIFFNFRRYSIKNVNSTNSRLDSLLKKVGVNNERILSGTEDIDEVLQYKIDYSQVNKSIDDFRDESKKWLLKSIVWKSEETKFIKIDDKELCSGCTACKNACPKNAIKMLPDNEGFLYPVVDDKLCIECGICKSICPILNKRETKECKQSGYIFQHNNEIIRKQSTSGGAFTAIANYIIKNNGIVFGAGFDKEFKVCHQSAVTQEELKKFRNSKYVQSNPKNTFKEVKENLEKGILTLYSGTACQIEGLKSYLGKDYDNLITVDVICRAVPSPLFWEKYFCYRKQNKNIKRAYFREKIYGYKYSNLSFYDENNNDIYHNGIDTDPYLRAFFSNIACRPSCYNCSFKGQYHKADFTIWDCFEVNKFDETFDDDRGTTRILINTEKANELFSKIKSKHHVKQVDVDKLISNFYQMFNSIKYNSKRSIFFEDLNNKNIDVVLKTYFPNTLKCKIEKTLRIFLIKLGLYHMLINFGRKLRKRD